MTETAKEDEQEYFELLGSYENKLENVVLAHREKEDHSTAEYNQKIPRIIEDYGLTKESVEQALIKVSSGDKKGKDSFWFIQDPVKFEFLLTIYAYMSYGNDYIYKPNYIADEAGIPYSHAPGNIGDIEIYNKDRYWLLEATLIRNKNQQINNETVNLFRHIDETKNGHKYLTLVAPYIHDDTRLLFNVASVITMMQSKSMNLSSDAQTTEELIDYTKKENYFGMVRGKSRRFVFELKDKLNEIAVV